MGIEEKNRELISICEHHDINRDPYTCQTLILPYFERTYPNAVVFSTTLTMKEKGYYVEPLGDWRNSGPLVFIHLNILNVKDGVVQTEHANVLMIRGSKGQLFEPNAVGSGYNKNVQLVVSIYFSGLMWIPQPLKSPQPVRVIELCSLGKMAKDSVTGLCVTYCILYTGISHRRT